MIQSYCLYEVGTKKHFPLTRNIPFLTYPVHNDASKQKKKNASFVLIVQQVFQYSNNP